MKLTTRPWASLLLAMGFQLAALPVFVAKADPDTELVGRASANRFVTPVNQVVVPMGRQVDLPGLRPQVIALSPNGRLLVVSGKTSELLVLDPVTGEVRQRVELPAESPSTSRPDAPSANILAPDKKGQVSQKCAEMYDAVD